MTIIDILRQLSGVTLPEPFSLIEELIAYAFAFVLMLFAIKILFGVFRY